jgi:ribonucleoside-diphosphate reductase alpha chain|tara:strand:+ start:18403 stop:20109 length:1707 start_codon:yes stop_codon:yes gene_type:complete
MKLEFIGEAQLEFLKEGLYIEEGETPLDRVTEIVERVRTYEGMYKWEGLADLVAEMIDKNYLSLSTPGFSNFGRKKKAGASSVPLPASCNIITVGDSIYNIAYSNAEAKMLSKLGAAAGTNYTRVSEKGTRLSEGFYSNSKLDWIEDDVSAAQKVSQGAKRRGYVTPFISILDKELYDLLKRIDKNNPDKRDPLVSNTVGIIIPRGFWKEVDAGNKDYQKRILDVLKQKQKTGKLYLLDVENCNKNSSPVYKALGLEVEATNICTEFIQPLFDDMTSVCVIAAINAVHWDIIKENPLMIKAAFYFLDIMNEEYVTLTKGVPFMERAHKAARDKRDIGLGVLGFHELLQKKNYAFGDMYSRKLNKEIFSTMRAIGEEATKQMGIDVGVPEICRLAGMIRRNASLMMVAPNKSTSFIAADTTGGVEIRMSNIHLKSLAKIQYVSKNKHLDALLKTKDCNLRDTWISIEDNNGSVDHLDFLTDHEKDVFKTFSEVSPKDIIDLAADRQEFIDMGQSLNLIFRPNYTLKDIYDIHRYGFNKGIKTFYYGYPSAHAALEKDGKKWDDCPTCAD